MYSSGSGFERHSRCLCTVTPAGQRCSVIRRCWLAAVGSGGLGRWLRRGCRSGLAPNRPIGWGLPPLATPPTCGALSACFPRLPLIPEPRRCSFHIRRRVGRRFFCISPCRHIALPPSGGRDQHTVRSYSRCLYVLPNPAPAHAPESRLYC